MSDNPSPLAPPRKEYLFATVRAERGAISDTECEELAKALAGVLSPDPTKARAAARQMVEDKVVNSDAIKTLDAVDACAVSLALEQSTTALANYATYDEGHAQVIAQTIDNIERYLNDHTLRRPLNFLLKASPGAGKSHFVGCITEAVTKRGHRIKATNFNMASMSGRDDLIAPLDAVRNSRIDDDVPLLFLDEFDTSPGNYGLLLPLLWDGAISVGRRDLKLGRVVIVMAGSSPALPKMVKRAKTMRKGLERKLPKGGHPKMIDLFSRVNGSVIQIPPFGDPGGNEPERKADKVAVAVALLTSRFKKLQSVPLGLLRLVARLRFRYDVRSIAHLIDSIRPTGTEPAADRSCFTMGELNLPLSTTDELTESSLAYHVLSEDGGKDVVAEWKECLERDVSVPVGLKRSHTEPIDEVRTRLFCIRYPTHANEHRT